MLKHFGLRSRYSGGIYFFAIMNLFVNVDGLNNCITKIREPRENGLMISLIGQ